MNPKCFLISVLTLFLALEHAAGQYEQVWVFGNDAGVDFNGAPQSISTAITGTNSEACASVCDGNGNLLFYTQGSNIWNRDHNIMPNGAALVPGYTSADMVTSSASQGTLIVPFPGSAAKYLVFSLTAWEFWGPDRGRLYYSVVDMNLDGGKGDVIPGQKGIFLDSMLLEKLTAVPGNACNVWIICGRLSDSTFSSLFEAFEITASGVNHSPVFSGVGLGSHFAAAGVSYPSPDGRRIVSTQTLMFGSGTNGAAVYDFDGRTGMLSNPLQLLPNDGGYGACFSPDGSKVYINTTTNATVAQFDLSLNDSAAILNSRFDWTGVSFSQLKAGPDSRVYLRTRSDALGGFIHPNLAGSAAGFDSTLIVAQPGTHFRLGLPNIIPVIRRDTLHTLKVMSGACFSAQQALAAVNDSTGWDYQWNTGAATPGIVADTPGTYWLRYFTPPCVYRTDTFHLDFPYGRLPDLQIRPECHADSNGTVYASTYPGDPVGYTYTWIRGADTLAVGDTLAGVPSGAYSLHVQTSTGCDTLLFFDIPEEDFRVSFEVSDTLICLGDVTELTNTSDTHFVRYHWAFDNGDISVVQTPSPYVYPESGAYRLMLAGEGVICKDTTYQTILVDQPLLPAFEIEPEAVCVGQPVSFFPTTDATTVQLTWDIEGQLHIEPQVQPRYQHSFASSGSFPVTLSIESRACPDTSVIDSLRVYPYPEVDLGADSSICLHGQPVYLKNLREAPLNPYHQLWSTGDTTEVLKVVHPGTYTLSVSAEPIGCTTTESVEIRKDCYIDIPNAFTPDGDGHNDYFLPRQLLTEGLMRFHMQVFNRWGQLLYETNHIDGRGWDGRFNGTAQPRGVYLYQVEAAFQNGRRENYEGNVTLIR